ncbi:hypothetical protein PJ261_05890 [Streptococcus dysgalactiae]|uniref:hypothetical protein n=1 Tax=Streptococcus dysgalactiae TaxID=1334 RepID=UPI0035D03202
MVKDIIVPIVSVVSIFISNYLGRKSDENKNRIEMKRQIYLKLYVPLIKLLIIDNIYNIFDYENVVINTSKNGEDNFLILLTENIELLPNGVIKEFKLYAYHSKNALDYVRTEDELSKFSYEYIPELFDKIFTSLIKQGISLAKELELTNQLEYILNQHKQNLSNIAS